MRRNWQAAARINTASAQDSGPICSFGSRFAGYSLSLENGVQLALQVDGNTVANAALARLGRLVAGQ